ncbi:hypothetical protein [Porphyromonas endodontalis]|uniref:hypothetical protein n=1 Tax=Porphyromonas endodontalis TaxID=28124 RepID=UPI0028E60351|nr:hypothetical protein [Porphyromonas endodontalis]
MRKSILVSLAVLFAAVVAVGCKRSPKNKEYVYDVYVAGYEEDAPMLWKNGEPTKLSHNGTDAISTAVFVSGNDVYAAGLECVYDGGQDQNDPSRYVGVFWKNGIISRFTDLAGKADLEINDLFVSGGDVYLVGQDKFGAQPSAMLWKNGIAETLSDGSKFARAYSVFVSGNDVYVAGDHDGVALWKNKILSKYTNDSYSEAHSVFVSGNDVYVVGRDSKTATLWKNGVVEKLTDGSNTAYARSVFVSGNDIYVVGFEERKPERVAMLWTKRGESGSWESKDLTDGSEEAVAFSVYVIDNHIYVVGYEREKNSTMANAMLWTKAADSNSWEAKRLSKERTSAGARSVYVVKREK